MKKSTVGIIGCGVAGMTAAIYLKRAGISCLIIEEKIPGGQIVGNDMIENYPGFSKISGTDLAISILNQVKELQIEIIYTSVLEIKQGQSKHIIKCEKESIEVEKVIIATGRQPRKLKAKGETTFFGRGISYCAICDGTLYKEKKVLVVGGGDSAIEATLYLSKLAKEVVLLHRKDNYRAKKYLVDKIKAKKNITYQTGEVQEFQGAEKIEKVKLKNNEEIFIDGVFIYIGQVPNTQKFQNLNILTEDGYIKVDTKYRTSQKGIYAVGDCIKKDYYQIVIAMAEAASCALYIAGEDHNE